MPLTARVQTLKTGEPQLPWNQRAQAGPSILGCSFCLPCGPWEFSRTGSRIQSSHFGLWRRVGSRAADWNLPEYHGWAHGEEVFEGNCKGSPSQENHTRAGHPWVCLDARLMHHRGNKRPLQETQHLGRIYVCIDYINFFFMAICLSFFKLEQKYLQRTLYYLR